MDNINEIVSRNIRSARQERKLSLEELSKLSGISKSMLVQIEKGCGNPSLSTLWKIANGMKVPFSQLIASPQPPYKIVKLSDIDPITEDEGKLKNYVLFPDDEDQRFSIYYIEVVPGYGWTSEAHVRETIEYITIFEGELELELEDETFGLKAGESIRFKGDVRHSYKNTGDTELIFHNILYNP